MISSKNKAQEQMNEADTSALPWKDLPDFSIIHEAPQPPTVEELEAIQRAAQQEGYMAGHEQGMIEANRQTERFVTLIESLSQPLAQLDDEVNHAFIQIVIAIANSVLRVHLTQDEGLLENVVREALDMVKNETRHVEIQLHPDDLPNITYAMTHNTPQIPHKIVANSQLLPGDVRIHTEALRLDASLNARLNMLASQLTLHKPI